MQEIEIGGRLIGPEREIFVVAEMSANHQGDFDRAVRIMEAAREAGADAVKLQTLKPDGITIDHHGPDFVITGGLWDGYTLYDLYEKAYTPWQWHRDLFRKGREMGLTVFSTPFDLSAVDFLVSLGVPALKIASFELVDIALIAKAAGTGKPLILSTGMASLGEIEVAVRTARTHGDGGVAVLHCISGYPTPLEEANLKTISHLSEAFGTVVGLSDHTPGIAAAITSVALGASVIEKHLTLRRSDGGLDAAFSLEPQEFKAMVDACRDARRAVGRVSYELSASEKQNKRFRRSLYAVRDISAGEVYTEENIRSIRPGFGVPPKALKAILGRKARENIARGTALKWHMVD